MCKFCNAELGSITELYIVLFELRFSTEFRMLLDYTLGLNLCDSLNVQAMVQTRQAIHVKLQQ
jgi:hypothetical protein